MKWEDICARCSLCCYERVSYPEEVVVDKSSPCSFLDTSTGLCTVYHDRFKVCSECFKVTFLDAVLGNRLPPVCAYIKWAKRHHIRIRKDRGCVISEELT